MTSRRLVAARVLLVVLVAAMAAALLSPIGPALNRLFVWAHRVGLYGFGLNLSPAVYERAANVVGFVPLTFLLTMAWPGRPWWLWALVGCAGSIAIEVAQFWLPRDPSLVDVLMNSLGAALGALLGLLVGQTRRNVGGMGQA